MYAKLVEIDLLAYSPALQTDIQRDNYLLNNFLISGDPITDVSPLIPSKILSMIPILSP